jgi:hypothetical protein
MKRKVMMILASLHFSLFLSYSNFSTVFGHQIGNMKKQVAKERWDAA